MKKKVMVSIIVLLLCIGATIGLGIATNGASTDYEEVKVMVLKAETKQKKVLGKRWTVNEVIVSYKGQRYELKNMHSMYAYQPGREVMVFLSGGKMYANVEGVKTSTPLAMVYFVFLFASFGMVFVTAIVASKARGRA